MLGNTVTVVPLSEVEAR